MNYRMNFSESLERRTLLAAGFLDAGFRSEGLFTDDRLTAALDVAVAGNGGIVAAGYESDAAMNRRTMVTRYGADGGLDESFGVGGFARIDLGRSATARAVAIEGDGDIVVVGGISTAGGVGADVFVARLNSSGVLDNSFSSDGVVTTGVGGGGVAAETAIDVGIDGEGRIVVAVRSEEVENGGWHILRFTPSGDLDTTFGDDGVLTESSATIHAIEVLGNGKILAAGSRGQNCSLNSTAACGTVSAALVRYDVDGSRDLTFTADGIAESSFEVSGQSQPGPGQVAAFTDIARQGNRIIAVGLLGSAAGAQVIAARFTRLGAIDFDFDPNRILPANTMITDLNPVRVEIQPNNRIIVGATASPIAGKGSSMFLARLTANGGIDDSFGVDGRAVISQNNAPLMLHSLALQPTEGRIIAGGRSFDIAPGDPELGRLAVAGIEAFEAESGEDDLRPRGFILERPRARGTRSEFSVRYIDDTAIATSSLDNRDILVTGPRGYREFARFERFTRNGDDVIAVYSIPAPGGRWGRSDEGRYSIRLRGNQVADSEGNRSRERVISRFRVGN
jgi:uncharacterized delta-60 repeat protein